MYVTRATDGVIEATYVSHRVMPMIEGSPPDPVLESLVNIAHFGKIAVCGCSKQTTTCGELPKVINTDHHQKPACAGCIGLRLHPRPPPRGCRAQQITTASASPSWGRCFGVESKNLHGTGWCSMQRSLGQGLQSSGVAASCLVNRGQLGKPRLARRWGRFFWIGIAPLIILF